MCAVIGVIHPQGLEARASDDVYRGLLALQHRGQDASGILSFDFQEQYFYEEKNLGLVSQVFTGPETLKPLKGEMALGHNRYATVGSDGKRDLQPMMVGLPFGMAMAHNGNVVNYFQLKEQLQQQLHLQLLTRNDLEVLLQLWATGFLQQGALKFNFDNAFKACCQLFDQAIGSYSVVGMVASEGLFAFRDPSGIRPLCLGRRKNAKGADSWAVCSEEVALNFLGFEFVRDVAPGEFIFIASNGQLRTRVYAHVKKAHCMFEWVYFASAESSLENRSVYGVRLRLGEKLAQKIRPALSRGEIRADIVVPVPDTGRTAAIAMAEQLGLPYREGLIKNRYVQRSFILNSQSKRESAVELKLSPIKTEIMNKDILLVDDSLVRGTTSKKIVDLLRRFGAREITLAITCPPIKYPCYYGIDFPKASELLAHKMQSEEMADWLGVSKIIFVDEEDLKESLQDEGVCMGCLNQSYPTSVSEGTRFADLRHHYKENTTLGGVQ